MKSKDSEKGLLLPAPGKRIAIIGATGSGKTTLARQLSRVLGIYHIELDAIMWLPGWQKQDWAVTRRQVQQKMDANGLGLRWQLQQAAGYCLAAGRHHYLAGLPFFAGLFPAIFPHHAAGIPANQIMEWEP